MDWKNTIKVRILALFKIPLVAFLSSTVQYLDESRCLLKIPFKWRTKNQLGSMFFGAMTTAADITYGLLYFKIIEKNKHPVPAIIKEFRANFSNVLKRMHGFNVQMERKFRLF